MNTSSFVDDLLGALADIGIEQVMVRTEGPVVNGRAPLREGVFLAFYYNQSTGTQAFAAIEGTERIWGIDCDNVRGWHLHPEGDPSQHVALEPQSVPGIIRQLGQALAKK